MRSLVVAALFGGIAGWLIAATPRVFGAEPPIVPLAAPIVLLVVVAFIAALAVLTHQRIQKRRERIEPERAVALLVLGKATALAGALVAAGYLVFGLWFTPHLDAPLPRGRALHSAIAVVAGVGLMIAGLRLERACRVPEDRDPDPSSHSDPS